MKNSFICYSAQFTRLLVDILGQVIETTYSPPPILAMHWVVKQVALHWLLREVKCSQILLYSQVQEVVGNCSPFIRIQLWGTLHQTQGFKVHWEIST